MESNPKPLLRGEMMNRVPFRHQVSEYDCTPTTVLNALSSLFDRDSIHGAVVKMVYLLTLDDLGPRSSKPKGTSDAAVEHLSAWLNEFNKGKFVRCKHLLGEAVTLRTIAIWLKREGVAVLQVNYRQGKEGDPERHHVLVVSIDDEWAYCFCPHPLAPRASKPGAYEFLVHERRKGQEPNMRISKAWLEMGESSMYQMGAVMHRECLLLKRRVKLRSRD